MKKGCGNPFQIKEAKRTREINVTSDSTMDLVHINDLIRSTAKTWICGTNGTYKNVVPM